MDAFTTLKAVAVPLDQANIDTDQIIPARFLGKTRDRQVDGFFHDTRLDPNGRPREGVTLNNPAYKGAKIIVGEMPAGPEEQLRQQVDRLRQTAGSAVVVVGWSEDSKVQLIAAVTACLSVRPEDDNIAHVEDLISEMHVFIDEQTKEVAGTR